MTPSPITTADGMVFSKINMKKPEEKKTRNYLQLTWNKLKVFGNRMLEALKNSKSSNTGRSRNSRGKTLNYAVSREDPASKSKNQNEVMSENSLYNLIKQMFSQSRERSREASIVESLGSYDLNGGEEDDVPIIKIDKTDEKDKLPDVSSPLLKEAWKEDAKLILNGAYERLKRTKFGEKYSPTSLIGQGSFGFVLKARRLRDGTGVAVKFILRQNINSAAWTFNSELGMVPNEVHFVKVLNHPQIVQFLDYYDDGKYVYLVTELHGTMWSPSANTHLNAAKNPGLRTLNVAKLANASTNEEESPCDLFECIEAHYYLPEKTIHCIFSQLYSVIRYLAKEGVLHRDLKDENVVVDADYRIKIVDFGSATWMPKSSSSPEGEGYFEKFNGTLAFAPPEVIRGHRYRGSEAEVWTLGILLYTMAFRQSPFPDSESILFGRLEFPYEEESPGILDLVRKMLNKTPANRIKLMEIGNHPWMLSKPSEGPNSVLNSSTEHLLQIV